MKLFWLIITIFALAAGAMVWAQARIEQTGIAGGSGIEPRSVPDDPMRTSSRTLDRHDEGVTVDRRMEATPGRDVDDAASRSFDDVEDPDDLARELVGDLLKERQPTASNGAEGLADGAVPPGHDHTNLERAENPWADEKAASGAREAIEHSVERRSDGSLFVDGLFNVRGDGTANSPYEITWDLLMSAAETYQPRLGMTDMPERIKMLDGKHVRISGFLMFPMATFEAKEALVMLNMWDGCCIGTMPSPYDAIEVQFTKGIPSSVRQFASYGTVQGKLVVDPYLLSDWLIGLYLLEDATLDVGM